MTILVTGSAGFIGSALSIKLLDLNYRVIGLDNHNDYYSTKLKTDRLTRHNSHENYTHYDLDLIRKSEIFELFDKHKPKIVVNLAAQAGVRYSLENPRSYIDSNIVGFLNILEACRHFNIHHLIYASSSSVYGANKKIPFSVRDNVDHPLSLYAATKKSNELMAHTYSHLFGLCTTGLRFFTVYGPWDRPDMALQKFAMSIINEKKIDVFNHGKHKRDFTYIDDIIDGIIKVVENPLIRNKDWSGEKPDPSSSLAPWRVYNIGSNNPIDLLDYITLLENELGKKAHKRFLPLQPGDMVDTFADVNDLSVDFNYKPKTKIEDGIKNFSNWFKEYYKC